MTAGAGARDRRPAGGERLVALDVDGTLLTSAEQLSPRVRAALGAAAEAGWHLVLVTGRPLAIALPVVHDLALGEYLVAANGATVATVADGAVLYQSSLAGDTVVATLTAARAAVPGLGLAVTTPRGFFREPGFAGIAPLSESGGDRGGRRHARGRRPRAQRGALRRRPRRPRAPASARAAAAPEVAVTPSGLPGSVELTAPGVHKGSGLAWLCGRIGVDAAAVVAFGDGLNDHEMLAWSGWGVAMGNAEPVTQELADEVTASNDEDGVALVLERLLADDRATAGERDDRG